MIKIEQKKLEKIPMFCKFCPNQLQHDKVLAFQEITTIISLIDQAREVPHPETHHNLLDHVIDKLYDLRMLTNNAGICSDQCLVCERSVQDSVGSSQNPGLSEASRFGRKTLSA